MARRWIRWTVVLIVAAALIAAVWNLTRRRPLEVVVQPVERGLVESTVVNTRAGTVTACRRARLAPRASGVVVELPVERGDRVEQGDLLLELWSEDLAAALELARDEVRTTRARQRQACLAAELAAREAARLGRLFDEGIVGESEVDRVRSERDTTQAACEVAGAAVAEAEARVALARAELSKTVLRAPFAGVVAEVEAELGEVVTPSPPGIPTPPAVDLIEEGCLYVVAPIDEVDAPRVRVGQPARVTLDAFPDDSFEGTVRRVAPYVLDLEKQARTVDVEVTILDPTALPGLAPGYSVDVEILLARQEDVLRIPTRAVIAGNRVLLLDDGTLVERRFEPGVADWQYTQALSGLEPGERVVVSLDRDGVEAGAAAVAGGGPE